MIFSVIIQNTEEQILRSRISVPFSYVHTGDAGGGTPGRGVQSISIWEVIERFGRRLEGEESPCENIPEIRPKIVNFRPFSDTFDIFSPSH